MGLANLVPGVIRRDDALGNRHLPPVHRRYRKARHAASRPRRSRLGRCGLGRPPPRWSLLVAGTMRDLVLIAPLDDLQRVPRSNAWRRADVVEADWPARSSDMDRCRCGSSGHVRHAICPSRRRVWHWLITGSAVLRRPSRVRRDAPAGTVGKLPALAQRAVRARTGCRPMDSSSRSPQARTCTGSCLLPRPKVLAPFATGTLAALVGNEQPAAPVARPSTGVDARGSCSACWSARSWASGPSRPTPLRSAQRTPAQALGATALAALGCSVTYAIGRQSGGRKAERNAVDYDGFCICAATLLARPFPRPMNALQLVAPAKARDGRPARPAPIRDRWRSWSRLRASGVCGSDMHTFSEGGIAGTDAAYPCVLGHEPSGEVAAVGPGRNRSLTRCDGRGRAVHRACRV